MLCSRLITRSVDACGQACRPPFGPLEGQGGSRLNESMASRESAFIDITPEVLLKAYSCGIFPMAESADDPALYWIEPQHRGILPLDSVHVPRRLAKTVRTTELTVAIDRDYDGVIAGCAAERPGRRSTWINSRIRSLYRDLFKLGHCHTVEVWEEDRLVG